MAKTVEQITEDIYTALQNDNHEIDERIKELKIALKESDQKEAVFEAERLVQNNRQGRKRLQSYFKKRGVNVAFK